MRGDALDHRHVFSPPGQPRTLSVAPCPPNKSVFRRTVPTPRHRCQDEASASRATLRMTTMAMAAAAAAVQALWREARAPCLKTTLSGKSRAAGPLFCCCCGGRQDTWSRGLVLSVFTPVRMPGSRMLPSLPTVSRGHPASGLVNRKWGETASHKSQAGNDEAVSWAHGSQLTG